MAINVERDHLIEHIVELEEKVYRAFRPIVPKEWLGLDLTMPQLKIMLLLFTDGPARMGILASALGVSLATETGIVDRLVQRNLVLRESDPDDRRVVVCKLSETGNELVAHLWELGQAQTRRLMETMSLLNLQLVDRCLETILEAASTLEQRSRGAALKNKAETVGQS